MIDTKEWMLAESAEEVEQLQAIVAMLTSGEVVAFPTETVYGLGADATNEKAVANIFKAKGRPQDNPLIAHVATKEDLKKLVKDYPAYVDQLINAFSPGPITYILPSNGTCAKNVTAGLDTVGVRIPSHPVAQAILQACSFPVAAPSANTSGKPSPTTAAHVKEDLFGKIGGIVDGGKTGVGMESTIVDCTSDTPVILRPGGVTKEQIRIVIGDVMEHAQTIDPSAQPQAPGMKYKHYAPEVPLILVHGNASRMQEVIDTYKKEGKRVGVLARSRMKSVLQADQFTSLGEDTSEVAANLYSCLRSFSKEVVDVVICETFLKENIGVAIMNRLEKAATHIIE